MVVTIVVIVGIIVIGVGILAYMNRTEKGIESGITSFRRELHALAPRPGEESRSSTNRPVDDARGVTIMPGADQDDDEAGASAAADDEVVQDEGASANTDDTEPPDIEPPDAGDSGSDVTDDADSETETEPDERPDA